MSSVRAPGGSPVRAVLRTSERNGLPIAVPKELGERMGWPVDDSEAGMTLEDISAPGEEDKYSTSYRAAPWPDRSCCRSLLRGRSSPSSADSPRPIGKSRGYS